MLAGIVPLKAKYRSDNRSKFTKFEIEDGKVVDTEDTTTGALTW